MNFFVIILLWQHILYLCTSFLVQGGKCVHVKIKLSPQAEHVIIDGQYKKYF